MEQENNTVFRQKSLDRINSPEALDRYIKTTNPSVWVLLVAIIIFLAGIIVWGVFGTIENKKTEGCSIKSGVVTCVIKETDSAEIKKDSFIVVNGEHVTVENVNGPVNNPINDAILHLSGVEEGEWYYTVSGKTSASNSESVACEVVFESINPIKFVLN